MSITEFLEARIAEDEADARLADGVTDKQEDDWQDVTQPLTVADTLKRESWAKKYGHAYQHICRHDPARVLAECEFKRFLLAKFGRPCPTLFALAAVYADHPDYRPEWRP